MRAPEMLGLRPFGVSFLFAGWDEHFGYQLYQSDPSGNYGGWKATAIGANNPQAQSILKTDYKVGETTVKVRHCYALFRLDLPCDVGGDHFVLRARTCGQALLRRSSSTSSAWC